MSAPDYASWSRDQLIARITRLEASLPPTHPSSSSHPRHRPPTPDPPPYQPDFSRLPKRKIALRFCYAGEEYAGLAFQSAQLTTPTVEGTIFAALARARLVDPAAGPEGCGWERSGRTDAGVSGAGNVISLWVRSALGEVAPTPVIEGARDGEEAGAEAEAEVDDGAGVRLEGLEDFAALDLDAAPARTVRVAEPTRELRYVHILNLLLPPSIRMLAWAPVAPSFSARFHTRARHYKYFFARSGLDVARMHAGAQHLVGEHDFRNLCRLDAAKQLTSFRRRVLRADVSFCSDRDEDVEGLAVLDLVGSAFLYNQVRHIMAVLFLVGAGLERPELVKTLLNADATAPDFDPARPLVDRKPDYQMADPLPLVLWDCQYDPADVTWRRETDDASDDANMDGSVLDDLHAAHHRSRVRAALDAHFVQAASAFHVPSARTAILPLARPPDEDPTPLERAHGVVLPLGGGTFRRVRRYVPVLERKRLDSVEDANRRWREGKGARKEARKALVEAQDGAGADGDE